MSTQSCNCASFYRNVVVSQNPHKHVSIEESLTMTIVMLSNNHRMWMIADRFNNSTKIVYRNIHEVLRELCTFTQFVIRSRSQGEIHPKILNDQRFFPWIQDAVRAIDGTHIPVSVPKGEQVAFTNRYGQQNQNVLGVCDHDMRFVYVYVGWEGSAYDARVLDGVLTRPNHFLMPLLGL